MRTWCTAILLLQSIVVILGEEVAICQRCNCTGIVADCKHQELELVGIGDSFWQGITKETEGAFDNNHIGRIPVLPALPFTVLSFSYNRIVKIDDRAFTNVSGLRVLILSNNDLTSDNLQPNAFQGEYDSTNYQPLNNLETLDLSSNELHTLDDDLFEHLPFLRKLYLQRNPFKVIDKPTQIAIASVSRLEVLDLSYTGIKELPQYFLHTPKYLKQLYLKGNQFREIPDDVLAESHNLTMLNLNENPIAAITTKRPFPVLANLVMLHISFMPNLTRIENYALGGLTGLQYLECKSNANLTYIGPQALRPAPSNETAETYWPPITNIDLSDNALATLDEELVGFWEKLKHIEIRGNPWSCECENQWMISDLVTIMMKSNSGQGLGGLTCVTPEEMRGRSFEELNRRHYTMRCLDLYGAHPENDSVILVTVFAVVIIAMVMIAVGVWFRRNTQRCRKGGTIKYETAFYKRAEMEEPDRF